MKKAYYAAFLNILFLVFVLTGTAFGKSNITNSSDSISSTGSAQKEEPVSKATETPARKSDGLTGVRLGIGTDINLGTAYGIGINRLMQVGATPMELGAVYYGGHSEETSTSGIHSYTDITDVHVFGVLANFLHGYDKDAPGLFAITGFGVAGISVTWEESSPTDTSLGTRVGAGSKMSAEGTTAGSVINLGLGINVSKGFDIRAEIPVIFVFSAPGKSSGIIPTGTLSLGFKF